MSEFHGGFFVRSVDPGVAEPIRIALATALRERRIDLERNHLTFAALSECPVMHVAVRGEVASGRNYAWFHQQHAAVGSDIARAARTDVWAYHYENEVGSESVQHFAAHGRADAPSSCTWDELGDRIALDDSAGGASVLTAAPLGRLAASLGVPRAWLDMELGYRAPSVAVKLNGESCTDVVTAFLTRPLPTGTALVDPEATTAVTSSKQSLHIQRWMADELAVLARRLGVTTSAIAWAAWEAAKHELHDAVPRAHELPIDDEVTTPIALVDIEIAAARGPRTIVLPLDGPIVPPAIDDNSKVKLMLAFPPRVIRELQVFASRYDRSVSWTLQQAYQVARDCLHAATRRIG